MSTARCYFVLNLFHAVAAVSLVLLGVVFLNYIITAQAILLSLAVGIFFVLASALEPDSVTGLVRRKPRIILCVATFVSLFFMGVALINPAQYIFSECPQQQSHHHPHTLELQALYSHGKQQEMLLLNYDAEHGEVTRALAAEPAAAKAAAAKAVANDDDGSPVLKQGNADWLVQQRDRYRLPQSSVCEQLAQADAAQGGDARATAFPFIAAEAKRALHDERRETRDQAAEVRITAHHSDDHGYEHLKRQRQFLNTKEICQYEWLFTILYMVYILLLIVLQLFTLLFYAFTVKDTAGA